MTIARERCTAMVVGGSEGRADLARAFDEAGLAARLALAGHGSWIPLGQ